MAENQSVKPETLPPSVTEPLKSKVETKKTPLPPEQKNEVAKTSKIDLAQLKKDIEAGRITPDMIKDVLENLGEFEEHKKAYVLSFVIAGLEKKGISVDSGYQKFTLSASKLASGNVAGVATETETKELEILLNEYVNKTFHQKDILQALMMRTPEALKYSEGNEKKDTNSYVNYILKKYGIKFSNPNGTTTNIDCNTIQCLDENNLQNHFIPQIKATITDPKERAFVLTYIQDEKYNKGKNSTPLFDNFNKLMMAHEKAMQAEINKLTPQQQQALGGNDTIQQRFQNLATNPAATFHDMNVNYKNGDAVTSLVLGIIGGFLGGKKFGLLGGLLGLVAGILGGAAIGGGNLNNLFKNGANGIKDAYNSLTGKPKIILSNNKNILDTHTKTETPAEYRSNVEKLLISSQFGSSEAKNLDIFALETDFTKQQLFFKKFGFELTQENKTYVKQIFTDIKAKRLKEVGDYQNGETVEEYLTKDSVHNTSTPETALNNAAISGAIAGGAVGAGAAAVTPKATDVKTKNAEHTAQTQLESYNSAFTTSAYTKDGKNYIIGPDGKPTLIDMTKLSPEFKKQLEKYKEVHTKIENFLLLLNAIKDSKKIGVSNMEKKFGVVLSKINPNDPNTISQVDRYINESMSILYTYYESQLNLKKHGVDVHNKLSIIPYIRDYLKNSSLAGNALAKDLFSTSGITEEELSAFGENPNINNNKLKAIFGTEYTALQTKTNRQIADAKNIYIEQKETLIASLEKQGIPRDKAVSIADNELQNIIINEIVINSLRIDILKKTIEKAPKTEGSEVFKDLYGVGGGILNPSDKSISIFKDITATVAIEAVAIILGTVSAGILTYSISALNAARLARLGNTLRGGSSIAFKGGKMVGTVALGAAEGAMFNVGYGLTQKGFGNDFEFSVKGFAQAAAFGAMSRTIQLIPGLKIDHTRPIRDQKLKIVGGIALEGTIFGVGNMYFGDGEWSYNDFVQAFILAAAFKGVQIGGVKGHYHFNKNKAGAIELSTPQTQNIPKVTNFTELSNVTPVLSPNSTITKTVQMGNNTFDVVFTGGMKGTNKVKSIKNIATGQEFHGVDAQKFLNSMATPGAQNIPKTGNTPSTNQNAPHAPIQHKFSPEDIESFKKRFIIPELTNLKNGEKIENVILKDGTKTDIIRHSGVGENSYELTHNGQRISTKDMLGNVEENYVVSRMQKIDSDKLHGYIPKVNRDKHTYIMSDGKKYLVKWSNDGKLEVVDKSNVKAILGAKDLGRTLSGDELVDFYTKNFGQIVKNYKVSIKVPSKIRDYAGRIGNTLEEKSIKYKNMVESIPGRNILFYKTLLKELAQPTLSAGQLLDSMANSGTWGRDLLKLVLTGDRKAFHDMMKDGKIQFSNIGRDLKRPAIMAAGVAGYAAINEQDEINYGEIFDYLSLLILGVPMAHVVEKTRENYFEE